MFSLQWFAFVGSSASYAPGLTHHGLKHGVLTVRHTPAATKICKTGSTKALNACQTSTSICEAILLSVAKAGETVLVPFSGVASFEEVGLRLGMNMVGMDIDPMQVRAGQQRMKSLLERCLAGFMKAIKMPKITLCPLVFAKTTTAIPENPKGFCYLPYIPQDSHFCCMSAAPGRPLLVSFFLVKVFFYSWVKNAWSKKKPLRKNIVCFLLFSSTRLSPPRSQVKEMRKRSTSPHSGLQWTPPRPSSLRRST